MVLLKDELINATSLTEEEIKKRLIKAIPEDSPELRNAKRVVASNAVNENTWGYITMLYAPSDSTLKDRMLKVLK